MLFFTSKIQSNGQLNEIICTPPLIYKPLLLARVDDQLFLEAHRDIYRKEKDPLQTLLEIVAMHNLEPLLDWQKAKAVIERQEGLARDVTKALDPDPRQ